MFKTLGRSAAVGMFTAGVITGIGPFAIAAATPPPPSPCPGEPAPAYRPADSVADGADNSDGDSEMSPIIDLGILCPRPVENIPPAFRFNPKTVPSYQIPGGGPLGS